MALQIKNNSSQVQQLRAQQSWALRAKGWVVSAKDFAWSHKKLIVASGAAYAISNFLAHPVNAVANTVNAVSGLFRRNAADAAVEISEQGCLTVENVTSRTIQSVNRGVVVLTDAAKEIVRESTGRVTQSFDNAIGKVAYELRTAREQTFKVAELTVGAGITLVGTLVMAHSACEEKDTLCSVSRPIGLVVAMASGVYLITKNVFVHFRQNYAAIPNVHSNAHSIEFVPVSGLSIPAVLNDAPPQGYTPLMQAAAKGNIEAIIKLQKQGFDLNGRDGTGRTALHYAAMAGQRDAFELLWYFGANLEALDYTPRTSKTPHAPYSPIQYIHSAEFHAQAIKLQMATNRFKFAQPMYLFYPPENLVYKGGGPKGIAYVGIQKYLEEQRLMRHVRRIAGTSAGAINAVLVALGYKAREMQDILSKMDIKDFLDHPFQTEQELMHAVGEMAAKGGDTTWNETIDTIEKGLNWWFKKGKTGRPMDIFKKIYNSGGLCKGQKFLDWISKRIAKKVAKVCKGKEKDYLSLTLGELRKLIEEGKPFKHIYLYTTKIGDEMESVCINSEDKKWDNVIIADAVRASMSIPMIFIPHVLRTKDRYGFIADAPELGEFMDGGLLKNLPIDAFDSERYFSTNSSGKGTVINHQTLAFNLVDPPSESESDSQSDHPTLIGALAATGKILASGEEILLKQNPSHQMRMINIDNCGVGLITGFFSTEQEKSDLMDSGYTAGGLFGEQQEELSRQYAEHDPRELLSSDRVKALLGMPVRGISIKEVQDGQELADFKEEDSMMEIKKSISTEQEARVSTTTRETAVRLTDGSVATVTETEQVAQFVERQKMTVTERRKILQETDSILNKTEQLLRMHKLLK